jgi:hypothetical protein
MVSEMMICLLFGITEVAAAKALDLGSKCNMTIPHPTHDFGILKLYFNYSI